MNPFQPVFLVQPTASVINSMNLFLTPSVQACQRCNTSPQPPDFLHSIFYFVSLMKLELLLVCAGPYPHLTYSSSSITHIRYRLPTCTENLPYLNPTLKQSQHYLCVTNPLYIPPPHLNPTLLNCFLLRPLSALPPVLVESFRPLH